jgi:hypothetical protein
MDPKNAPKQCNTPMWCVLAPPRAVDVLDWGAIDNRDLGTKTAKYSTTLS